MPSVASEVSASQQPRVPQSNLRNRANSGDGSQNSPFSEMLDSTAPATVPPPIPGNARAEESDATRPAGKNGMTDAPADRNPATSTKDASAVADALNALGDLGSRIAVDVLGVFGGSGKAGNDAAARAGSDDGTTAVTDPDAEAKPDAEVAATLQAMFADPMQPVITPDIAPDAINAAVPPANTAVPPPVVSDAPAPDAAAASSGVPQIDALIAVQAAEQPAAPANAAQNQAVAADEAKPANGNSADDLKTDAKGKKEFKADAKALTQAKAEVTTDAKAPAAQPQFRQDADPEPQSAGKAAEDVRQNAAAPAGENPETASREHHAADAAGAAKAGAAPHQSAGAAASPDVTTAASAAAPGAIATEPPLQVLTPAHIQAQLQGQIQGHIPGQIQGQVQGQIPGHADTAPAVPLSGVAVEIATQASAGRQHFEIRLDPPELGRIDVTLDIDSDGNATTRLVVERTETLDLLKRDAHQLERALQQAGLKTSDNAMEFSLRQQFARSDDQGSSNTATIVVPDDEAAPFPAQRQSYGRLLGTGSGLDIRV